MAESERKPFLAFNQEENTNLIVSLEVQSSIRSVRGQGSSNLEGGSERRVRIFWVAGPLLCKVFELSENSNGTLASLTSLNVFYVSI